MKKFPDDSKISNSFPLFVDLIYIGILWLLCSLPIVSMGPASAAMYYATVKSVRRGRGHAGREFFAALKENFKNGIKLWLMFLGLILLWGANLYFGGIARGDAGPGISAFLIIPVLLPLPWGFAYMSRFDNSFRDTVKFSVLLSLKNLPRTIMLLLILAAFVILGWLFPALIPLLPGLCCLLMSLQTEPVFRAITQELETDENQDKWYNE